MASSVHLVPSANDIQARAPLHRVLTVPTPAALPALARIPRGTLWQQHRLKSIERLLLLEGLNDSNARSDVILIRGLSLAGVVGVEMCELKGCSNATVLP